MYPSKILLFGEYTILLGSSALAIPYNKLSGELAISKPEPNKKYNKEHRSNQVLFELFRYLQTEEVKKMLPYSIDFKTFEQDLVKGLYFRSDIPEESGLGSSGAVVAAIFERYIKVRLSEKELPVIKECLGLIESFFHETSSGVDPLVSYVKTPVLIKNHKVYMISDTPLDDHLHTSGMFLVHSKKNGNTGEMIKNFKIRIKSDSGYLRKVREQYIPVNDECIISLLNDYNALHFFPAVKKLISLQVEIFEKMIPSAIFSLVNYGLENDLYFLKLCGSGGGGHFIGFTKNIETTNNYFADMGYSIIVY
ncbi:MAG: hypothetical protein IPH69_11065 [Bacteroidales bacterium]|nr:hypothetical protein [Bacteroidales bacterium]